MTEMTNKQIKAYALRKMKGNWGNCFTSTVVYIAVILLVFFCHCIFYLVFKYKDKRMFPYISSSESIPFLITVVAVSAVMHFVFVMLSYVYLRQFIDISAGFPVTESRNRIMEYKKLFIKISVLPHFAKYGIFILCIIPGLMAYDSVKNLIDSAVSGEQLTVFTLMFFMMSVLVMLLSAVILVNAVLSLTLLPVILLHNPLMPISHAISLSFKKADGNKLRILSFYLSFIKFLPLCVLLYPILMIFPYFVMSVIIMVENLIGDELADDKFLDVFVEKEKSVSQGLRGGSGRTC